MLIKAVKNGDVTREHAHQCTHYTVTWIEKESHAVRTGMAEPGITLELAPSGVTIRLPEDADTVYVMNNRGDTTDKYTWPEQKQKGRKEMRHAG